MVECEGSGGFPAWATLMSESLKTLGRPGVPKMATWDSRGAGGLALAQDLKVCGAARDAVNVGLSLDPHRLPLPRPNNNGPEAIRSGPRGLSASARWALYGVATPRRQCLQPADDATCCGKSARSWLRLDGHGPRGRA